MAGVESAVRLHIERGDDLNGRDAKGMTPLMVAAARNKAAICRLLLAARADPYLLDAAGHDALQIAQAAGAIEAMQAIAEAYTPRVAEPNEGAWPLVLGGLEGVADTENRQCGDDDGEVAGGMWEAETDQVVPEGDSAVAAASAEIQTAITRHQAIDTSVTWDDFEAFLPEDATPPHRHVDTESRELLRLLLLRAVREGSVPRSELDALASGYDDAISHQFQPLLTMVINDLGAEVDERFEYATAHESFAVFIDPQESLAEEEELDEALAFFDDLVSGRSEPLRIYYRDMQREALLTAEDEIALGKAMERGTERGLDALAAWPTGIELVLEAVRRVLRGSAPLRWLTLGARDTEPAPGAVAEALADQDAVPAAPTAADDEPDGTESELGIDSEVMDSELEQLRASSDRLRKLAALGDDSQALLERREALGSMALARGFLLELADKAVGGESEQAFANAMRDCRNARDRMALANLKLVYSIAKKYLFSGQPLEDLIQEGNVGLLKAVDRYQWRKGFRFSTYATWWIRQQVGRSVADKSKTIRLPVHIYEKTQRIAQTARRYEERHGQQPSLEQLVELVELPASKISTLLRMLDEPASLHELPDVDNIMAAEAKERLIASDPMTIVEDYQAAEAVRKQLSTLKAKEERVVSLRYGIGVRDAMTLEEIGSQFDVTRERVRQIEAKALRKLKHPSRLDPLRIALGVETLQPSDMRAEAGADGGEDKDDDFIHADGSR